MEEATKVFKEILKELKEINKKLSSLCNEEKQAMGDVVRELSNIYHQIMMK